MVFLGNLSSQKRRSDVTGGRKELLVQCENYLVFEGCKHLDVDLEYCTIADYRPLFVAKVKVAAVAPVNKEENVNDQVRK